jgi:hypothetical protein
MSKQQPIATKKNITIVCGMLTSKTSVTKALLKERARDKQREAAMLEKLYDRWITRRSNGA